MLTSPIVERILCEFLIFDVPLRPLILRGGALLFYSKFLEV